MRLSFLWYMFLLLIIVGCGSHTQGGTKGSMTVAGAAIGTAAVPGIGTAVGAGAGWVTEKEVNRREAAGRIAEIRDEVQKQRALKLTLLAQNPNYSPIMEYLTKEFAPEIEKGRIAIFENGVGLNFYLNETFFFTQGKTLSEGGEVLFHKIYEKISSTPQLFFVVEDNNDNQRNGSEQNIWSIANFLHQKTSLNPQQILVKSNGKLFDISRQATTLPARAYPVRIILIPPSI